MSDEKRIQNECTFLVLLHALFETFGTTVIGLSSSRSTRSSVFLAVKVMKDSATRSLLVLPITPSTRHCRNIHKDDHSSFVPLIFYLGGCVSDDFGGKIVTDPRSFFSTTSSCIRIIIDDFMSHSFDKSNSANGSNTI